MMSSTDQITLRPLLPEDAEVVAEIFYEAVMRGAVAFYTREERTAWAGPAPDPERWRDRIGTSVGLMAERAGRSTGFMTLVAPGTIDLAFVHPDWSGHGIGGALLDALTPIARASGAKALEADVSKAARRFFARHGFAPEGERHIHRRGVTLTAYRMRKPL
ncbi:GNAT family N-acetyltransferase [Salipiger mucosus]|nr:GNAT family N-acetyltransferase [Salipiger mucosus]